MTDYIIIDGSRRRFECKVCGTLKGFTLPLPLSELTVEAEKFTSAHKRCKLIDRQHKRIDELHAALTGLTTRILDNVDRPTECDDLEADRLQADLLRACEALGGSALARFRELKAKHP